MENSVMENYKLIDEKLCVTTQELCDRLGISRKTLSEWESKGCPKSARGWWPLWDILKFKGLVGTGVKSEDEVEEVSLAVKKLKYEAELKEQQAMKAEYENAITRGEYISKEEATSELQHFFVILKRSMMSYSRKIANEISSFLDPATTRRIEKMITELTMDALRQLSIDGVYTQTKKKSKA